MSKKSIIAAGFVVLFALIFGAILIANFNGVKIVKSDSQIDFNTTPPIKDNNPNITALNNAFTDIAKAVTPTVVSIVVKTEPKNNQQPDDYGFHFFFGPDFKMPQPGPEVGSGSGVIISKDGYIVTNNHVVKDAGKDGIKVTLIDKREFSAKVIGTDPNTDVAVIKIEASDLPEVSFGNSDNLQVGEWVMAIGNPLGLNSTVTAGIVSALGRNIGINQDQSGYGIEDFIQTDAAINPGNSGGALVNMNGQLVGINSAIKTNTGYFEGYGFAIPVNIVKNVVSELIKSGKVNRGYIGVNIQTIDETMAKGLGLDKAKGVLVQGVVKDGAGEDAGIKVGDVILKVDGKDVNASNELQAIIASKHPGDVVNLSVFRDGKTIDKSVTLRPRNEENTAQSMTNPQQESHSGEQSSKSIKSLGMSVTDLDNAAKDKYKVKGGVMVASVDMYSESFMRGIREGYVITEANKKAVNNVNDLMDALKDTKEGDSVLLKIVRPDGQQMLYFVKVQ